MNYQAFTWPEYQDFMGEDWFREESYYDSNKDTYLIPEDRVEHFYNKKSLKHKVGDTVTIKSFDWYNDNKDTWGDVSLDYGNIIFVPEMSSYCGKNAKITSLTEDYFYYLDIDGGGWAWSDDMFEE